MERRVTSTMRLFPATEPFAAVAVDLLGPLPRTPEGYEYLLVMCDRFTKLTRVSPLKDTTALDVFASVLYQGVMGMLGVETNYATPVPPPD
ncbi:hypothetical protein MMPV_005598 [Pyropia vietnamensis]